jgi:antitoxin VapB
MAADRKSSADEVREPSVAYVVERVLPPVAFPTARPLPSPMEPRAVRLFRNGANQAVRIPKEWELPGNDAVMRREGDCIVIEAAKPAYAKGSPQALLAMLDQMASLGTIDEEFPDVDAGLLTLDDIDLTSDPAPTGERD